MANNRYVVLVNRAQEQFHSSQTSVLGRITPTSTPKQDRLALDEFRGAVLQTVNKLKQIIPPQDVRNLHRQLVASIEAYLPVIQARREATKALGDPHRLIAARSTFTTASESVDSGIDRAIARINARLSS